MENDHSNKNLQKNSFRNADLDHARFANSDLRGADFSGANLAGADFSNSRTGITVANVVWLLLFALVVSLASGYVAALAGQTLRTMLDSPDSNVRYAGYGTILVTIAFILYSYWRGVQNAITGMILPATLVAIGIGLIMYFSGIGTGKGILLLILTYALICVMFIVGTIARAAAGSLSNIIFFIVAIAGGVFGKSLGGGIASVIMAVSCALISKRALSGAKGFRILQRIGAYITSKYGTSFRNSKLKGANFSGSRLHNADFSGADLSSVNWGDAKKLHCIIQG